ncbi:MAG TPA: fructose-6-phosphate aldolase [Candidatus Baltobacteraceae bacterium]|nr:fructose-6-phosphate aldolase [Candidatus Baltobacteraceae bacterium]
MQIFLDTADVNEIRELSALGIVDGVTTNPSLVAKEGRPFREIVAEILQIVHGPVNLEVVSTDAPGMVREGKELAKLHDNVVVKIPLIAEGLKAVRQLSAEGIKTNVTLCFSAPQALLAAKAGAVYISPFVGRLDDISAVGMDLVRQIVTIYRNYDFPTRVLAASLRTPIHFLEAALAGAHVCTLPAAVLRQLIKHPLTDSGLERFLADWKKVPQDTRKPA